MLDGLIFMPLSLASLWIHSNLRVTGILAFWFVLSSFAFVAYSVVMHSRYGQTLGKMATRVKVLDLSEGRLSLRQALLRDSIPIVLTAVGVALDLPKVLRGENPYGSQELDLSTRIQLYASAAWFVAELATMLTNAKRRALHDLIAGSVVVRVGAAVRTATQSVEAG